MGIHTPPLIALALTLAFIYYMFRRDMRQNPNVTSALWIPFIWLFIVMSRFVTEWLAIIFGLNVGGSSVEEGSPVDAGVTLVLIIAGLRVLVRRQVNFALLIRQNQWVAIFFAFCFISIFWSDFPFVAFKRWFKILGQPIMALIILTEPDLEVAVITLFKRLTYVVVPVSILFIKYYPEYGRGFSEWTGQAFNTGIAPGKNQLGVDCLILGFFYFWYTLKVLKLEKSRARRNELFICAGFLYGLWWLFDMAQSSTSLVSCAVGIILMLAMGRRIRRENIGTYILLTVALLVAADYVFGISDWFFAAVGRDRTLTDKDQGLAGLFKHPHQSAHWRGF